MKANKIEQTKSFLKHLLNSFERLITHRDQNLFIKMYTKLKQMKKKTQKHILFPVEKPIGFHG